MELRDPLSLRPHKLHRHIPEPDQTSPEWFAFLDEVHAQGHDKLPPVVITDTGFVIDGWRRVLAAKQWKWPKIGCVIQPDEEAALIIVGALFGQRDMSRGAKVYFSIPLLPDYAEAAEKRRLSNLRKGAKTNEKPLIFPVSSHLTDQSLRCWAERLGTSHETVASAFKLRDLLHNPKSAHLAEVLEVGGKKLKPAEVETLQAQLRARYEPQLASGEKGVWFVHTAVCGLVTMEDNVRPVNKIRHLAFWTTRFNSLRTGAQSWVKLPEDVRERVKLETRGFLEALPEADQREIVDALLEKAS